MMISCASGNVGLLCNCVLPPELSETKIRAVAIDNGASEAERRRLKSHSSRRYAAAPKP